MQPLGLVWPSPPVTRRSSYLGSRCPQAHAFGLVPQVMHSECRAAGRRCDCLQHSGRALREGGTALLKTDPVRFSLIDREIVSADSITGDVYWHGRPFDAPVESVMPLAGTQDAVVLLDYMTVHGAYSNLIRVAHDGTVRWRAELPTSISPESYVNATVTDEGQLLAWSWSGNRVVIDTESGRITSVEFVK